MQGVYIRTVRDSCQKNTVEIRLDGVGPLLYQHGQAFLDMKKYGWVFKDGLYWQCPSCACLLSPRVKGTFKEPG